MCIHWIYKSRLRKKILLADGGTYMYEAEGACRLDT